MSDGGDQTAGPRTTAALPGAVLREVVAAASACLDDLPSGDVPAGLRRVRQFAPARRGAAGAGPLAAAVDADPAFRQRVASWWRRHHAELVAGVEELNPPVAGSADRVWGAGVFLLRPSGWMQALAALAAREEAQRRRRQDDAVVAGREAEIARLTSELDRARRVEAELREDLRVVAAERDQLRKEIRRERSDADRARAQARRAEAELGQARAETDRAVTAADAAERRLREWQADTQEEAERRRRGAHRRAELDEVRARLLLDTVVEAAAGLRRELALPPAAARPADLVVEQDEERHGADAVARPGLAVDDQALLEQWLRLPQAHLVVDGYNVTKTAHPQWSLSAQRRWLTEALSALVARTGAEVTCCFDGVAVQQEPGQLSRGVRVLFSGADTEADELVRRLVRAEPRGRALVVVSSDAEVVRGVAAHGARCASSSALVHFLGR